VRHDRYDEMKEKHKMSDEDLASAGVLRIHPSFRMIALAEPPVVGE
jgi:von Willebrand factor A domain-containing protein 8